MGGEKESQFTKGLEQGKMQIDLSKWTETCMDMLSDKTNVLKNNSS